MAERTTKLNRRRFLRTLTGIVAAPMIVRTAGLLMSVRVVPAFAAQMPPPLQITEEAIAQGFVRIWERGRQSEWGTVLETATDPQFKDVVLTKAFSSFLELPPTEMSPVSRDVPLHIFLWKQANQPRDFGAIIDGTNKMIREAGANTEIAGIVRAGFKDDGWDRDELSISMQSSDDELREADEVSEKIWGDLDRRINR